MTKVIKEMIFYLLVLLYIACNEINPTQITLEEGMSSATAAKLNNVYPNFSSMVEKVNNYRKEIIKEGGNGAKSLTYVEIYNTLGKIDSLSSCYEQVWRETYKDEIEQIEFAISWCEHKAMGKDSVIDLEKLKSFASVYWVEYIKLRKEEPEVAESYLAFLIKNDLNPQYMSLKEFALSKVNNDISRLYQKMNSKWVYILPTLETAEKVRKVNMSIEERLSGREYGLKEFRDKVNRETRLEKYKNAIDGCD